MTDPVRDVEEARRDYWLGLLLRICEGDLPRGRISDALAAEIERSLCRPSPFRQMPGGFTPYPDRRTRFTADARAHVRKHLLAAVRSVMRPDEVPHEVKVLDTMHAVSVRVSHVVPLRFDLIASDDGLGVRGSVADLVLLGVLLALQADRALAPARRRLVTCPGCENWFLRLVGQGRRPTVYCSPRCGAAKRKRDERSRKQVPTAR